MSDEAPLDLDELASLARAATPGPWSTVEDAQYVAVTMGGPDDYVPIGVPNTQNRADAAFIAAANPSTVLRLIEAARLGEALRDAAKTLREAAVKAGAHIVVTNDYPDGVKAFGQLCDAIDVMDEALATALQERQT